MPKMEGLRREVKRLASYSKGHIAIGGMGPDVFLGEKDMAPLYKGIEKAYARYEKKQTAANLAELHDAIIRMGAKHFAIAISPALDEVKEHLHATPEFKRLQDELAGRDFSKMTISKRDAMHLADLSAGHADPGHLAPEAEFGLFGFERHASMRMPEFNGTMRFVGSRIEPTTTNLTMNKEFAAISLKALLESRSHGFWHTHQFYRADGRPSLSDEYATFLWKIPLVTAMMGPAGKPQVFITAPDGKSYPVKQLG